MFSSREDRRPTDIFAIYLTIGLVAVLFSFIGYAFLNGSIYRITNGYDDCGNVCGRSNPDNTIIACGINGTDMRDYPLTLVVFMGQGVSQSKCARSCPSGYALVSNRCLLSSSKTGLSSLMQEIISDLSNAWFLIVVTCIVAMIFSYMLLMLFRYAAKYVIWIVCIGIVVFFIFLGVATLVIYTITRENAESKGQNIVTSKDNIHPLLYAMAYFVIALVVSILLYVFRKKVQLVIQLFKEASKALMDVPTIVVEPILTFLALSIAMTVFIYFMMICYSAGRLRKIRMHDGTDRYEFLQDAGMVMAFYLNIIAFIWFVAFIMGCQSFVIAGTVCQWFFSRDKTKLDSPVSRTFRFLLQFHLGSVCLGSLLITSMKIIIWLIKSRASNQGAVAARCCGSILGSIEDFLNYLTKQAYIIVALDGSPLFKSGKKAVHLLKNNLLDVIALNKLGDLVLFLGKLFVVAISGFVCYELVANKENIYHPWIPIALTCIFAYLIVDCFMTVFEMTIDTIFICFCEDVEQNDGVSRPYFMSENLMQAMSDMKSAAGGEFNFGSHQHPESGQRHLHPQPPPVGFVDYSI